MTEPFTGWHVGVAAEAFAAAMFARCGYDVSVQYGANQPEYDLMVARGDQLLKVSVKGSKDGGWGLCQGFLERGKADYHAAIDRWLARHKPRTVFCFVQFEGVALHQMPRLYLATPEEVASRLHDTAAGRGDTTLFERHEWGPRAIAGHNRGDAPIVGLFGTARRGTVPCGLSRVVARRCPTRSPTSSPPTPPTQPSFRTTPARDAWIYRIGAGLQLLVDVDQDGSPRIGEGVGNSRGFRVGMTVRGHDKSPG